MIQGLQNLYFYLPQYLVRVAALLSDSFQDKYICFVPICFIFSLSYNLFSTLFLVMYSFFFFFWFSL